MIRVFAASLMLLGCVSAPVAPNLKIPDTQSCKTIDLSPVPSKAYLDIRGDKVAYDIGGEQLLRGYVACRSLYK